MSDTLLIRKRLRRRIIARCQHWGLKRQRVPASFIAEVEADLDKHLNVLICARLNPPAPLPHPPEPKPRAPKAPGKRCLKSHPTLAL